MQVRFEHDDMLRRSIDALHPTIALMSLIHLTGDRALLDRYWDELDGRPVGYATPYHDSEGRPIGPSAQAIAAAKPPVRPEIAEEIKAQLLRACQRLSEPLLEAPDEALFGRMLRLVAGFDVPARGLPLTLEQAGFVRTSRSLPPTKVPSPDFHVVVIGAGMVGINAAIKLKEAGFRYSILEKSNEIGGTWSVNTYPGVAVDTPSSLYSFSFELNPSWTRFYPSGAEYMTYLNSMTDRHGLREHIDFGTEMTTCRWDEERQLWEVWARREGQVVKYEANAVITALGYLHRPSYPDVPGMDEFGGSIIHTAEWDDAVSLTGKRVVIVGTGCSAAQVTAAIADDVSHLTVLQRQPNWIVPNAEILLSVGAEERFGLENLPYVMQWQRAQLISRGMSPGFDITHVDENWQAEGGYISPGNDSLRSVCLSYLEEKFADRPDLKATLTPDYPPFAKRPIRDCGYYDALRKPNVALVEGSLAGFTRDGIELADGSQLVADVVILATGFHLDFMTWLDIEGRDGAKLADVWSPVPRAYLGLMMPGFPNLFFTCGPNSALSALSHTTTGEQQVHYIIEALQYMTEESLTSIDPTIEAFEAWNEGLDRDLADTVWVNSGAAHGYYRHRTGKVVLGYPRPNLEYWHELRVPNRDDFTVRSQPAAEEHEPAMV